MSTLGRKVKGWTARSIETGRWSFPHREFRNLPVRLFFGGELGRRKMTIIKALVEALTIVVSEMLVT